MAQPVPDQLRPLEMPQISNWDLARLCLMPGAIERARQGYQGLEGEEELVRLASRIQVERNILYVGITLLVISIIIGLIAGTGSAAFTYALIAGSSLTAVSLKNLYQDGNRLRDAIHAHIHARLEH